MRVPPAEFLALDLEAHGLLQEIPLRDVSIVDLAGGERRTIADVRRLMDEVRRHPALSVRVLLALRRSLGWLFRWDREKRDPSYASRLSDDQRRRSLSPVGTPFGPLRLLYEFPYEMLGETRNATVHAFSCMALRPCVGGYRLYWAIYVESVSAFTPLYMAAIEPFRRFVLYPSILEAIRTRWSGLSAG